VYACQDDYHTAKQQVEALRADKAWDGMEVRAAVVLKHAEYESDVIRNCVASFQRGFIN
jgi:hypothetical protein